MHGAKAIMTAEPPSRQELRQNPTIIVKSPLASQLDEVLTDKPRGKRDTKKQNGHTEILPPKVFNPYAPSNDPSQLLKHMIIQGSKESLSNSEHDTYL